MAEGALERVGRGRYRSPKAHISEHHGLALTAAAVPRGVVCLLSALTFHGIGTQNPSEVWMAIDRRARAPRVAWPPIRVVRFSGRALTEGVENHRIEGESVRVYKLARTIADCFKYRKKLGMEVVLEALLGETSRPTRDADFLGYGDLSTAELDRIFREVCDVAVEPDGVTYAPDSVDVAPIRVEDAYGGQRITLRGLLGKARLTVQADVGIGDAVTQTPEWIDYPSLLDLPRRRLRVYRPETAIAEKLHAMATLGMANTRMRDFFDVYEPGSTNSMAWIWPPPLETHSSDVARLLGPNCPRGDAHGREAGPADHAPALPRHDQQHREPGRLHPPRDPL